MVFVFDDFVLSFDARCPSSFQRFQQWEFFERFVLCDGNKKREEGGGARIEWGKEEVKKISEFGFFSMNLIAIRDKTNEAVGAYL